MLPAVQSKMEATAGYRKFEG